MQITCLQVSDSQEVDSMLNTLDPPDMWEPILKEMIQRQKPVY